MSEFLSILAAGVVAVAQSPSTAPSPPPVVATPAGPATPAPPAPAIHPGMPLLDQSGAQIGSVQTVAETPGGLNVVVKVDGKLVGAPLSALKVEPDRVISNQTKEQLLAAAGAGPE